MASTEVLREWRVVSVRTGLEQWVNNEDAARVAAEPGDRVESRTITTVTSDWERVTP